MNFESRHLTWAWLAAAVLFFAFGTQSATAQTAPTGVVGSKHDFSQGGPSGYAGLSLQVCVYCHAPHAPENAKAPLWNHTVLSTTTYKMYDKSFSATMDATVGAAPGNVSKLCLSCHDGTVAIDAFGGGAGTAGNVLASGDKPYIGTDLTNDHPIGFTYNTALTGVGPGKDPGLRDPAVVQVGIGFGGTNTGTINDKMLGGTGQMECASCHDVHNSASGTAQTSKLLRITSAKSQLCLACHIK